MGEKVFDGVIWIIQNDEKPLEEQVAALEAKWDLEMANFPSLQPSHFRLSLEFFGESLKSALRNGEGASRSRRPPAPASFVGA